MRRIQRLECRAYTLRSWLARGAERAWQSLPQSLHRQAMAAHSYSVTACAKLEWTAGGTRVFLKPDMWPMEGMLCSPPCFSEKGQVRETFSLLFF